MARSSRARGGPVGRARRWRGELDLAGEILAAAVYAEDVVSGEWTVEAVVVEPE